MKFAISHFSEVYTGNDWANAVFFIQTGHFRGTENVPFVNVDKNWDIFRPIFLNIFIYHISNNRKQP